MEVYQVMGLRHKCPSLPDPVLLVWENVMKSRVEQVGPDFATVIVKLWKLARGHLLLEMGQRNCVMAHQLGAFCKALPLRVSDAHFDQRWNPLIQTTSFSRKRVFLLIHAC